MDGTTEKPEPQLPLLSHRIDVMLLRSIGLWIWYPRRYMEGLCVQLMLVLFDLIWKKDLKKSTDRFFSLHKEINLLA